MSELELIEISNCPECNHFPAQIIKQDGGTFARHIHLESNQTDTGKELDCPYSELNWYKQRNSELAAQAIKDFVSSMIAALESGFVDTNTITLAQIHRVMQNHVKDDYGVDLPHITEEWGNEVAELCGFDVVGGRLSQKAKDGSRPPTPPRPPVKPVG